jgi:hypothetical protein
MITLDTLRLDSIRGRLWLGFGVLVAMLVVAGVVARRSFAGISETITQSLAEVQSESQLASALFANIAKTVEAGSRYLDGRDSTAQVTFRKFGWESHDVLRQMNDHPGQSATEVATVATIDNKLSSIEIDYALAHRLVDLGRVDEARKAATRARRAVDDLSTASIGSASSKPTRSRPRDRSWRPTQTVVRDG